MLPTPAENRMGQSPSYHYRQRSGFIGAIPNKLHIDPRDLAIDSASLSRDIKLTRAAASAEHRTWPSLAAMERSGIAVKCKAWLGTLFSSHV